MDGSILKYMAFVKTVECGSFTRAAALLQYSQSGISRMIGDLEREWGLTLLRRDRSGVRLTAEGLRLLPFAQALCKDYAKLQTQVDDLNGLRTGFIRIGTFSSVATHLLPPVIAAFQKDYPHVDYELVLGDYEEIEGWLRTGQVDCGFVRLPTDPDFAVTPFMRDDLLAVLPQGHPLADADAVPLAAFCAEPFLLLGKAGKKTYITDLFERCGMTPQVRFTTWDDYAIMSMVENGLGISILPQLILRRTPYRIVTKPLSVPAFRDIVFALRDADGASLAVRKFMTYLSFAQ